MVAVLRRRSARREGSPRVHPLHPTPGGPTSSAKPCRRLLLTGFEDVCPRVPVTAVCLCSIIERHGSAAGGAARRLRHDVRLHPPWRRCQSTCQRRSGDTAPSVQRHDCKIFCESSLKLSSLPLGMLNRRRASAPARPCPATRSLVCGLLGGSAVSSSTAAAATPSFPTDAVARGKRGADRWAQRAPARSRRLADCARCGAWPRRPRERRGALFSQFLGPYE